MKRVRKPVFFIIALLIFALSCVSFFGIYGLYGDMPVTYIKGVKDIRWGIDIKGGVEATFKPAGEIDATNEQLDAAKSIIETRLVKNNITDYELYADYSNDKIIVRFPWKEDETDFNPEKAIDELSATASLTFREGKEYDSTSYDSDGNLVYKTPAGVTKETILIEGKDIASAQAMTSKNQTTNQLEYSVQLNFTDEGKEKFAEATSRLVGNTISIWMDDIMISYPTVNTAITDGVASITGN